MSKQKEVKTHSECAKAMLPVKDALDILKGRWKLPIIISLLFGAKRFGEISKEINGITDKMLSKELKDLEVNQLVKRTVYDSFPPVVEYSITPHGKSLERVINELRHWGMGTGRRLRESNSFVNESYRMKLKGKNIFTNSLMPWIKLLNN